MEGRQESPACTSSMDGGQKMIANIQALRALAALLVVVVHLEQLLAPLGVSPSNVFFGGGGVDLFFVISGFIMVYTTAQSWPGTGNFLMNRIIRIVPLYWLMTLMVFALALIAPSLLGSTEPRADYLAKSLAFIPFEKTNGRMEPILFLGWTLNYEMFFYLVLGLGLGWKARGLAGAAFAFMTLVALGLAAGFSDPLLRFYTNPILLEFVIGMAIGAAYLHPGWEPLWTRASPWIAGTMIAGGLVALVLLPFAILPTDRIVQIGLASAAIVFGALWLERMGLVVRSGTVLLLGNASYAIYLTHPFVTQAVTKVADMLALDSVPVRILLVPVTYGLVMLAGVIVHLMIEKPMTRAIRNAVGVRRKSAPAGGM